ncbi:MAG TPA: hypothetical protein VKG25_00880 [Bryobacteraceae bacterium]|nr:hypothetical protein [Bryobacteraceae bacterium]
MLTAHAYDRHMEQLFERMRRFHAAMDAAGLSYRIIGGVAAFLHVYDREPDQARSTRDVDAAVARADLPRIIAAAEKGGFRHRHARGIDMLMDADQPGARSAVHLIFIGEKVRPGDLAEIPASDPVRTKEGIWICPVADLVRMKLTSFRLKDKVHIQDLDGVGLITPEIEAGLPGALRERLDEVRTLE